MKENEPLVYFLVLNYCSLEDTLECIKCLRGIDYINYKILVVDNNSPDKSGCFLKTKIPENEFIQLNKNIGYAGGNNYAMEVALKNKSDYVFIVNPDIRLAPSSLKEYIKVVEGHPEIGALNPVQLTSIDGSIDQRFKSSVLKGMGESEILNAINSDLLIKVETLFGASLLLSRRALEAVGGFDPLYFAYGEEEDLCRRLKYFGYNLVVVFRSPVIHLRNYHDDKINLFREFLRLKGRYLYTLKDINKDIFQCIKGFCYSLRADYISKKSQNSNIFFEKNYYRMFFWIFKNFPKIIKSRKLEKNGFSHLSI